MSLTTPEVAVLVSASDFPSVRHICSLPGNGKIVLRKFSQVYCPNLIDNGIAFMQRKPPWWTDWNVIIANKTRRHFSRIRASLSIHSRTKTSGILNANIPVLSFRVPGERPRARIQLNLVTRQSSGSLHPSSVRNQRTRVSWRAYGVKKKAGFLHPSLKDFYLTLAKQFV